MKEEIKNLKMERLEKIFSLLLKEVNKHKEIKRDQSLEWSIAHMYSCSQLAKLLAKKRDLDQEIAGIAGAIHDIALIITGKFVNHGEEGGPIVEDFLLSYNKNHGKKFGLISDKSIKTIVNATINHTKKKEFTDDDFSELLKDADSLDRFLHGKKTLEKYVPRIKRALKELGQSYRDY